MDIVTQGLLGATVGYAVGQKRLGNRSLMYGGIFGVIPDLDFLSYIFSHNPFAAILYHRGLTHSLFFAPVVAPLGAWWIQYRKGLDFWPVFWVAFWALFTHPLLDLFTIYGTQLLSPFTDHRFSISGVAIIDPHYSGILLLSILLAAYIKNQTFTKYFNWFALFSTTIYLFVGMEQNDKAYQATLKQMEEKGWQGRAQVFTGTLSVFQRRLVVFEPHKIHVAFWSTLSSQPIVWTSFPQGSLPPETRAVHIYRWYTSNNILYRENAEGFELWDMRYGFYPDTQDGIFGLQLDHQGNFKRFLRADKSYPKITTLLRATFNPTARE